MNLLSLPATAHVKRRRQHLGTHHALAARLAHATVQTPCRHDSTTSHARRATAHATAGAGSAPCLHIVQSARRPFRMPRTAIAHWPPSRMLATLRRHIARQRHDSGGARRQRRNYRRRRRDDGACGGGSSSGCDGGGYGGGGCNGGDCGAGRHPAHSAHGKALRVSTCRSEWLWACAGSSWARAPCRMGCGGSKATSHLPTALGDVEDTCAGT